MTGSVVRAGVLSVIVVLAGVSLAGSQQRAGGPPAPVPMSSSVRLVRAALAHAKLNDARQLIERPEFSARSKSIGAALIAIYQGDDDKARQLLTPLVGAADRDEATLQLGLLDVRHGHRNDGRVLLNRLIEPWSNMTPEDYFVLARAAQALTEYQLANDAFQHLDPGETAGPEIEAAWGDLFLEVRKWDLAEKSYSLALKADPAWVSAYLGLARSVDDDQPPRAAAAVAKALEIAPDDPGVSQLKAERALGDDNLDQAKAALDKLAAVRPGSIEEMSLRAAIVFAERRTAELEPAIARAQAINHESAMPNRLVGERAGERYHFEDGAAYAQKAVLVDGEDAKARFDLGLGLLRTGDEARARTELNIAWDLGRHMNKITKNLLDVLDDLDGFVVVPDGDMIFKFPAKEADVLKAYALPLGEEAYKTYTARYGFTPKGPILIEIFSKHDDFAVRTVGLEGIEGALGACFGRVVTMDSPSARPPGTFSWQGTLWHEMAHVFTLQLSKYNVPRWLTEGISVFEEHRRNPAWGRELTLEYAHALSTKETFGLRNLAQGFKDPARLSMAYFEASLVVEHLVDLGGDQALRTLLLAYADGATDTEAFTKAFGKDFDQVEASYNAFVETRYGALRDAMKDPPSEVEEGDMPALSKRAADAAGNFISQVAYGGALYKGGHLDEARAPLEKAAALAPQAMGNTSPNMLLAAIAQRDGDTARARQALRSLLKYDHTNLTAARELIQLATADHADDDIDFGLRVVTDIDPFDAAAHTTFGRRLMKRPDPTHAIVEFQAALALHPVNLAEAHTDLGEALLAVGKKDDAKKEALAALQQAPNYARAQDLLLAALGKLR